MKSLLLVTALALTACAPIASNTAEWCRLAGYTGCSGGAPNVSGPPTSGAVYGFTSGGSFVGWY